MWYNNKQDAELAARDKELTYNKQFVVVSEETIFGTIWWAIRKELLQEPRT